MDSYVLLLLILLMLLWVRENTATGVAALVARARAASAPAPTEGALQERCCYPEGHQGSVQRCCYRLARMIVVAMHMLPAIDL